ncbi:hypothetical protein LK994_08900 [Ferruginibacter lapsinanis]|uniref:hypothetical protein n=1 Tax=Ferruginibacter lapsinanis TaxID=563172 RepID=UPI001E562D3D|nr:hypothetical protein [Ferruginibacter lapsinanis]UEG48754.1 hypothetical protein LK994_08900 [Ferruginibacter lapsinanis]
MKIEQLLVQHLYNTKEVTLQGIGTFRLNPSVAMPLENDKDFVMPENAISFEYNLKATEDEALIDFITKQTSKIKPLASADLDSFVILAKQFLNIGKPLTIEGVGTVQKSQHGEYEFIPGQFITPKIDDIPRQLREKRDESVSFESESRDDSGKKKLLLAMLILLAVVGGLSLYYFLFYKNNATAPLSTVDTAVVAPVIDTPVIAKPDTTLRAAVTTPSDSVLFKIVVKEYATKEAAEKALARFSSFGHELVMLAAADSSSYRLAMPFKNPVQDPLIIKDSLIKIFGPDIYVELK